MVPAETQDHVLRAPQVCSNCKSIKKGCDKRLPSCSQCIKRRTVCRYGEPEEERRSRSENSSPQGRHERLAPGLASIPRSLQARLPPSLRLSLMLTNALSDVLPSNLAESRLSQTFASPDSVVHLQIMHIIGATGKKLDEIIARYFRSVHTWLPIISRRRFREHYRHFQTSPTADFSLLLLAMRLIIQHPSIDPAEDHDTDLLYLATKTLCAQVQAVTPSSLFLVQAAIIVGRYEHAHGLAEAAYVTAGYCGRMACAMNMHNLQCSAQLQGSDLWVEEEELLCTWWGLVILDRVIGCDPQMHGRPLATRAIRKDNYLPLEPYDLERRAEDLSEPMYRYYVSTTTLPSLGPFGREAQATFLFDRARITLETGNGIPDNLYHIARDMQNLLAVVMEQIAGRWGIYSGAVQMLILGLYNIHQAVSRHTDVNNQFNSYRETTEAALNTITRMMIDIAYAFNREGVDFDIEILYPATAHITRSAQQHLLTAQDYSDPGWQQDFNQIRKVLMFFSRRWALAGLQLRRLNETFEMSMALRM